MTTHDAIDDDLLAQYLAEADQGVPVRRNGRQPETAPDLFERWCWSDLEPLADQPLEWVVRGALVDSTYGQIAGAMKSLKTYVALMLAASVASGEPFLGRFPVDRSGPVLMYVGEGGKAPFARRLRRVARSMGLDRIDNLYGSHDVAPIGSLRFAESLRRDVDDLAPVLCVVDPFYAYHGTETDSRNLHHEGSLLSSFSAATDDVPARLIVNHFNQTGAGRDLSRITQAGSAEWVDSWMLTSHRSGPTPEDVEAGTFRLLLEIGSRQWGGTAWDLDLNIGRYDPDLGSHDGNITWTIDRHEEDGGSDRADATERAVLSVLADEPWTHTRTDLVRAIGGNAQRARDSIDRLAAAGQITHDRLKKAEGGRLVARERYGLPHQPRPGETESDAVGAAAQ